MRVSSEKVVLGEGISLKIPGITIKLFVKESCLSKGIHYKRVEHLAPLLVLLILLNLRHAKKLFEICIFVVDILTLMPSCNLFDSLLLDLLLSLLLLHDLINAQLFLIIESRIHCRGKVSHPPLTLLFKDPRHLNPLLAI